MGHSNRCHLEVFLDPSHPFRPEKHFEDGRVQLVFGSLKVKMSNFLAHHPNLARFRKFLHLLLQEEKKDLWILVIYGIWVSIFSLIIPVAVQTFVNTIGFGLLFQPILILVLVVFTFSAFSGVLRALQMSIVEVFEERLFVKTAMELANRISYLKSDVFKESYGSEWVNRFFDVMTLQKTISSLILDGATLFLQIIFGMLLLAFYHPFLLVLNFIILAFVFLFFFGLQGKALETSIEESKSKYSMAAWLQDLARHSASFRSIQSRKFALRRADDLATKYVQTRRKHFKVFFKQTISAMILQVFANALLLGVGGWLVVQGQLTLGQLVASELVLSAVMSSIGNIGQYLEYYYDAAAALDKIGQLFELPTERPEEEQVKHHEFTQGDRGIEGSHHSILKVKNLVVKDRPFGSGELNFEIPLGKKIALWGPSGAGKSEVLQSLYGMTDPISGVIEIEGVNLRYSSLEQIRSKIAYVSGGRLFDGTILDNIQLHRDAKIPEIQKILFELGLEEILNALPDGLHTQIRAGRYPLSRLQAQKILLARALVSKSKLILVDDIMDDFDPESDLAWKSFLNRTDFGYSMVFAVQNLSKAQYCDQIVDMHSGKFREKEV